MERYLKYSTYLRQKYGVKTYKLTVNLPLTCPNRDGNLGVGGCDFCGEDAANFVTRDRSVPVREQLLKRKDFVAERYNAQKFIAYFQNYSNTYLPLPDLVDNIREAAAVDDIVEVALATRPDCVSPQYLRRLTAEIGDLNLTLELGLQTVNYHILQNINRGHTLAEFIDAVNQTRQSGAEVGVHIILNLPGDEMIDVKENARILSALGVDTVKLHALYIRENSKFGQLYRENRLELISREDYINRVVTFLEYLDPGIAIQRLLGRAPEEKTMFVNWGYDYHKINREIEAELAARDIKQGDKFNYLHGKALKKFR